eukprot:235905-Pleurochrysis_carterae.AAC.1
MDEPDPTAEIILLKDKASQLCDSVFGSNPDSETLALISWLNHNIFDLPLRSSTTVEVSVKHQLADSCAEGVAASVLDAPFVKAQLIRDSEFRFRLESKIEPGVSCVYTGFDDLCDKLLNRFAMGYFTPSEPDDTAVETRNEPTSSIICDESSHPDAENVSQPASSTTGDVDGGSAAASGGTDPS